MLVPAREDLVGVIGATWEASIVLYSDEAQTVPFDLSTAYALESTELQFDGMITLTPPDELVIDGPQGRVDAIMTPEQTNLAWERPTPWRLKLVRADGVNVDYPIGGLCRWKKP